MNNTIGLLSISMGDKHLSFLPPFSHVDVGIPLFCQCDSLDGKIYVLGGLTSLAALKTELPDPGSPKVYVLDLVRQRHWKQCSIMQQPRVNFGCRVLNGKIYVFGGLCDLKLLRESEVYDPKTDAWSPIMPMMSSGRWGPKIEVADGELYLHGGLFLDLDHPIRPQDLDNDFDGVTKNCKFVEIYHPIRNEWRKLDRFKSHGGDAIFVARGKFYSMNELGISVRDSTTGSWTHMHSCSFEAVGRVHLVEFFLNDVLAVDDDLLARVYWVCKGVGIVGYCLIQSKGFGRGNERIMWDKVNHFLHRQYPGCRGFMSPVLL